MPENTTGQKDSIYKDLDPKCHYFVTIVTIITVQQVGDPRVTHFENCS